jgi:hypothetical protein
MFTVAVYKDSNNWLNYKKLVFNQRDKILDITSQYIHNTLSYFFAAVML